MVNYKKIFAKFIIVLITILMIISAVVIFFDPFYHYHKPLPFLKTVLEDKDYQVCGTIDHFCYDTVILGSSVIENLGTEYVDSLFDGNSLKIIKSAGHNADLLWYLSRALKKQDVKRVIYVMTFEEMFAEDYTTIQDEPYYFMMDKNPFNDIKYLLNKDVLFKEIPQQIAYSMLVNYEEGNPYSWYRTKDFSLASAMSRYYPAETFSEQLPDNHFEEKMTSNLELLDKIITENPEINFSIYFTPYSAFWWDDANRIGQINAYLRAVDLAYDNLSTIHNVDFYSYVYDLDMTFSIENYMDGVHFSKDVNEEIANRIYKKEGIYSKEEYIEKKNLFTDEVLRFSNYDIVQYYPEAVVKITTDSVR